MSGLGPVDRLRGDIDDLERIVLDIEFGAVREEATEIVGRLKGAVATLDALLSAVLPDGADDLLDDPEALLLRVRQRLGEEPEDPAPGPR